METSNRESIKRRLARIEGQVRGVQKMVEEDRYCLDILTQISAIRAGLDMVGVELLEGHAKGCLQAAMKRGESNDAVDEFVSALKRFVK